MCLFVCERERERKGVCMCVCVSELEREKESICMKERAASLGFTTDVYMLAAAHT